MAITYLDYGAISSPLKGRYAKRRFSDGNEAAFAGADLYAGRRHLIEPSLEQSAFIVGSEVGKVWHALRREAFRAEIISSEMPLVPPRAKKPRPKSVLELVLADKELVELVRSAGVGRVLDAAIAAEAAE